ncbi:MAG: restriction endonuclease subunit S [Duncaniella sp.]|nr:restriction endonuclease subunit S [Duncaniella sp.]
MNHGWEKKRWKQVLTIINGKNQKDVEASDGVYPIYGSGGVIGTANQYLCPENCTIIGRKGSINKPMFVKSKFWNVDTAFGIVPNQDLLVPKFLYYFCVKYDFLRHNKATTLPSLVKSDLLEILMPVPSIAIQNQIVSELDKLNEMIELKRNQLKDLDALAQSLFYETFGDPIENPNNFQLRGLAEVCDVISTGITYKPEMVSEHGTVVLRSSNIQESKFVLDDVVRIQMTLKESQYVQKNDILMCSRNGSARLVGKVCIIPELVEKMSWGAFMTIIRSTCYHYLFQYFRLPAFREQLTKTKTSTVNQITIGMLKDIRLPIPPVTLQNEFAAKVEAIEEQKRLIETSITDLETLLASRMDYWFND